MKNLFLLFCCIVSVSFLQAQSVFPIKKEEKWGVIDVKGKIIINPDYDFVSLFKIVDNNEIATFKKEGKTGILDKNGTILISPEYEKISVTENNKIIAYKNNKCGLFDLKGNQILNFEYDFINQFHENLFILLKSDKFGLANLNGNIVLEPIYNRIENFSDDVPHVTCFIKEKLYGLLNKDGEILAQPIYESISIEKNEAKGKKGMMISLFKYDDNGKLISAKDYTNQTALDVALKNEKRKKLAETVSKNPNFNKPRWELEGFRYKLVSPLGDDLLNGKRFYDVGIDEENKLYLAREFIKSEKQSKKKNPFDDPEGTTICYVIDEQAKILLQIEAEDIFLTDYTQSQYARASIDTLWDALINKKGEVLRKIVSENNSFSIQNIGNFVGGKAWIKSNNLYGFIDVNAKLVIPIQFELVSDYEESFIGKTKNYYAVAKKDGQYGLLDSNGKAIVPFIYDGISIPKEGLIRAKKGKGETGKWGALDLNGKVVIPFEYDLIGIFENGKAKIKKGSNFGLIDNKGKILIPLQITCEDMGTFKNGIARISKGKYIEETKTGAQIRYRYYGIVKENGELLLEPIYSNLGNFEEIWEKKYGLAEVRIDDKVGYLNYKGETVLRPRYQKVIGFDSIYLHNKGFAQVFLDGKTGYINHRGEDVIPTFYCSLEGAERAFEDTTQYILACLSNRFGVINHKGKEIIPFEYDALTNYSDNKFIAKKSGKWGLINIQNKPVMDFKYEGIRFLAGSEKKLLQVYQNNPIKYYVSATGEIQEKIPTFTPQKSEFEILKKGETVALGKNGKPITKYDYREIGNFSEGYAYALTDGKTPQERRYGFLNNKGELVISPMFTDAKDFSDGLAAVKVKGKWGFVDKTGNLVIKHQFNEVNSFSEGYATVEKTKIINKKGEIVGKLAREGSIVGNFQSGRAVAQSLEGFYHITPNGLPAYSEFYDEITPFQNAGLESISFVKKGELWELKRLRNYSEEITIKFNRAGKNKYEKEYPDNDRKVKTLFGEVIQDKGFTLIQNGTWKMIGLDGTIMSEAIFDEVRPLEKGFEVKLNKCYGIADLEGNWIAEPNYEVISLVGEQVIRLEMAGKIQYLNTKGDWIWK
ncbi:MAG: hypothetical protein OHK0038_08910 [Flammeovirgaceae bacterium]